MYHPLAAAQTLPLTDTSVTQKGRDERKQPRGTNMVDGSCLDAAEQYIMNSTLPVVWAGSCSVNVYLAGTLTTAASSRLIPPLGYTLVQDWSRFYHHMIPHRDF